MKTLFSLFTLITALAFDSCFEATPPAGVTGEVVGCITSGDDLLCLTRYEDHGVSDDDTNLTISGELSNYAVSNGKATHVMISTFSDGTIIYIKLNRAESLSIVGETKTYTRVRLYDTPVIVLTGTTPKPGALSWISDDTTYTHPEGNNIFTGYMIANLTRPEILFDAAPNVADIDVLQLPNGLIEDEDE